MENLDFNYIFEHSKIAMVIIKDEYITYSNASAAALLGYECINDIRGKRPQDLFYELQNNNNEESRHVTLLLDEIMSGDEFSVDWNHVTPEGKLICLNISMTKIHYENNDHIICCVLSDVTEKREIEKSVVENEEKFRTLFEKMNEAVGLYELVYDGEEVKDYRILDVNPAYEHIMGLRKADIIGKEAREVYKSDKSPFLDIYTWVIRTQTNYKFEAYSEELGRYFKVSAFSLGTHMFGTIFEDITLKKQHQKQIDFLSYHDTLTGLYNRAFYEIQLKSLDNKEHLPLSILMMDLNALKLVNDTFGHDMGDKLLVKAASVLMDIKSSGSFCARIGGDEFICVLPHTDEERAEVISEHIKKRCATLNVKTIPVSLSIGIATKRYHAQDIKQMIILADQDMYDNKQKEGSSIRKEIIYKIIEDLDHRSVYEKNHRLTVLNTAMKIGEKMNLSRLQLKNLRLLAMVHDIGKISVPVEILEKADTLTEDEFEIVKRHAEMGYRITRAVPEFSQISDEVLYHHERFDGKGYPEGIKTEDIPILSRILTVADSYEAMISLRPYKEPMPEESIIKEFSLNTDKQFDTQVAKIMIDLINSGEADRLQYKDKNI